MTKAMVEKQVFSSGTAMHGCMVVSSHSPISSVQLIDYNQQRCATGMSCDIA